MTVNKVCVLPKFWSASTHRRSSPLHRPTTSGFTMRSHCDQGLAMHQGSTRMSLPIGLSAKAVDLYGMRIS